MTLEKKVLLLDKEAKTPSQNLATNQYFVDLVRQKQYDLIARIYKPNIRSDQLYLSLILIPLLNL